MCSALNIIEQVYIVFALNIIEQVYIVFCTEYNRAGVHCVLH